MAKPGRNDPCPCGSGRKYKLCCGTVALIDAAVVAQGAPAAGVPAAARVARVSAAAPAAARECGSCTACCEGWAEGEIRGHRMFPGQPCHYLGAERCTIYAERPQSPCRNFVCGWLMADSPLPDAFRPDRIGVMTVPMRWRGAPALILVSAGNDPSEAVLTWMRDFAAASGVPFFYEQRGERFGFGPPAFQEEMAAKVARGERLW